MPDVPATIGRYQIREIVGRGGMGVLYRAHDPVLERDVALKVLQDVSMDDDTRERLAREAKAAAHLQHRNVVTIHEYGEANGQPYIAMEFLSGQDLESLIKQHRPRTLAEKVDIAIQLCEGLSYAHERGVVHRDIKPGNVRVLEDGTVKILDFGIARFARNTTTASGKVIGTPSYMSPEQISGRAVDGRADLFSVGVLLFELLSGGRPFGGHTMVEVIYQILNNTPVPLRQLVPDLPEPLERIVRRGLEKDPNARYQRASDMALELKMVRQRLAGQGGMLAGDETTAATGDLFLHGSMETPAPSITSPVSPTVTVSRAKVTWAAIGLIFASGALAGYLYWGRPAPPAAAGDPSADALVGNLTTLETVATALDNIEKRLGRASEIKDATVSTATIRVALKECDLVIAALTKAGQTANADMLKRAYALRAQVRMAAGDATGAETDFVAVLRIDPNYSLPTSIAPAVTMVFERVKALEVPPTPKPETVLTTTAAVPPPVTKSLAIGAPPPPAPKPTPLPPPTSAVSVSSAAGGAAVPGGAAGAIDKAAFTPPPAPVVPAPQPKPPPAVAQPPVRNPNEPVHIGAVDMPERIKEVKPVVPSSASARVKGAVSIEVTVGPDGKVKAAEVKGPLQPALDQAALDAVKQWLFQPPRLYGSPATVVFTVLVEFDIR